MKPDRLRSAGGILRNLLICGVLLFCGLWAIVAYGRARHRANYVMTPNEYCEQTSAIRNGMTAAEVEAMLRGVSSVTRDGDSVYFSMDPYDKRGWVGVSYFISIRLDDQGRVIETRCYDG